MDKYPVFNLSKPERTVEVYTITDPGQPGVKIELNIAPPDLSGLFAIGDRIEKATNTYLKAETGEIPFIPYNGGTVDITEKKLQIACAIAEMQVDHKYTEEEILVLIETMPSGMLALINKANGLIAKLSDVLENPTEAADTTLLSDSTQEPVVDTLN